MEILNMLSLGLVAAQALHGANATVAGPASPRVTDQAASTVTRQTPVAWLRAQGNASDLYKRNDGVMLGGVSTGVGLFGGGFVFNGAGGRVGLSEDGSLPFEKTFTVSILYKPFNLPNEGDLGAMLLFRGDDRTGWDPLQVNLEPDGKVGVSMDDLTNNRTVIESLPVAPGVWHHLLVSRDLKSGLVAVFSDGILSGKKVVTSLSALDSSRNPGIGIGNYQINSIYKAPFSGIIAEVKIYRTVVTPLEDVVSTVSASPLDGHRTAEWLQFLDDSVQAKKLKIDYEFKKLIDQAMSHAQ